MITRSLAHRLRHGHRRRPWLIDWYGGVYDHGGCMACCKEEVMRAIRREPRRIPPRGVLMRPLLTRNPDTLTRAQVRRGFWYVVVALLVFLLAVGIAGAGSHP